MRWKSRSWLRGLLTVLMFGLVLMHHTPSHSGHDAAVAPAPGTAAPGVVAMTERPAANCPCRDPGHEAPLPGGTGEPGTTALLHLCLAVLAALCVLRL